MKNISGAQKSDLPQKSGVGTNDAPTSRQFFKSALSKA